MNHLHTTHKILSRYTMIGGVRKEVPLSAKLENTAPVKRKMNATKRSEVSRSEYEARLLEFMQDGKESAIKEINAYVGCGGNWARDYMTVHGVIVSGKRPSIWRLK